MKIKCTDSRFWYAGLVDDDSYAFAYNSVNIKRPLLGTGLVINSLPVLEPMIISKEGNWCVD